MKKIRDQKRELAKAGKTWQKDGKMANLAIQSLAYFFILLGGLLMVVAVILPFWKEPDYEVKKNFGLFLVNFPDQISLRKKSNFSKF